MALKFSGAYRHCKPCTASNVYRKGAPQHSLEDPEEGPEGSLQYSYRNFASSSSTPGWNFSANNSMRFNDDRVRLGLSSNEGTPRLDSGVISLVEEEEPKEWIAQVEPGVLITFVSLRGGGNDLKRIRFSREMFNKWQAQRWWTENYDKILELYNVQRFNHQAVSLPMRGEEEERHSKESSEDSPVTPPLHNERLPRNFYRQCARGVGYSSSDSQSGSLAATPNLSSKTDVSSMRTSSSREADRPDDISVSASNVSEQEIEWVEEDEPGVYITIRSLPGGFRELRRVRFSREKFGEVQARLWWEENRVRIHQQYL
eukprot:TRINITY_DN6883_c0_g1_i1.p1 TRINITY_DN6883_c0_g1~~TRINITY_DN6883_c0_g1_i1.p1  ORF type:complete len:315 (+),score=10.93 TRINITY_DN6883_c0_g1_i1:250-1194(+)